MKNSDRIILKKMIGYCDDIKSFIERFDNSYDAYISDKILQYACNTCIIQIGELSTRVSDEFKEEHKEIPWRIIKATRNVHTHDYDNLAESIVWQTLTEDIPELRKNLMYILENMD